MGIGKIILIKHACNECYKSIESSSKEPAVSLWFVKSQGYGARTEGREYWFKTGDKDPANTDQLFPGKQSCDL